MNQTAGKDERYTAVVSYNTSVYEQPDESNAIGVLEQGTIVKVRPQMFMGKAFYTLVSGEGPTSG